jgi:alkylation response protein AidB-like acyl-CoA dehydrogenase
VIELDLTLEQELLRETVRDLCAQHAGPGTAAQFEDDPFGYPERLWAELARVGVAGLTIPVQYGGSGLSLFDAALVYQELGRTLVPTPHFASSVLCAGMILQAGSARQRRKWLPAMAEGSAVMVPAWLEPDRGFGRGGVAVHATAAPDGSGWTLTGSKRQVPFAAAADRLLVLAWTPAGVIAVLVDPGQPGVTLTQQRSIAPETHYRVDFDAAVADEQVGGWDDWQAVMLDGIVLLAALACGGARHTIDTMIRHSRERFQFGQPFAAFPAMAPFLADSVSAVEAAELLVREAASARGAGRPIAKLAPMAKLFATKTFADITAAAQRVLGAEVDLYARRAKHLQRSWWDSRHLEELIATAVLETTPQTRTSPAIRTDRRARSR